MANWLNFKFFKSLIKILKFKVTYPLLFLGEDFPDPGEDVDPDTVGQVGGAVTQLGEGGQVRNGLCKRQTEIGWL